MADLLNRFRYRAIMFTSTRPALYYGLRRISGKLDSRCIAADTDLVIEGYPRSANSTTRTGFIDRQPGLVKLAHHLHQPAQLLRAVQWGIPAVMLIRSPQPAALSVIALRLESERRKGVKGVYVPDFLMVLRRWLTFYRATLPVTDNLVIAPFEEVTANISTMIHAVNTRFGTAFSAGPPLRALEKLGYHTQATQGYHALPTALRDEIKSRLKDDFARQLEDSPRLCAMLEEANALHREVLKRHELSRLSAVAPQVLPGDQPSK